MTSAQLLKKNTTTQKGFTLIELLIVIGILAVLMGIVLVAINPAKQFKQANDTKRQSDVNAILNAVDQFAADNKGSIAALDIPTSAPGDISSTGVNLCSELVPTYIAALPSDPLSTVNGGNPITNCGSAYDTLYTIVASTTDNRVTVTAQSEVNPSNPISVTR